MIDNVEFIGFRGGERESDCKLDFMHEIIYSSLELYDALNFWRLAMSLETTDANNWSDGA